ncbi:MAG: 30S ribosomal protein S8 [Candidatus Taylorbacteria bacterium RIFCSPHIGHO2_02_FULL_45_28]|uniref:Small ribosomal subunit protein uS8 n=1 Tax=Candidatus Taylorbacteria bacterium RIFCSPHIGHO2_12_FULL_45_16 TaxID=1802315 RepID=A0A1G2N135_9BACT|nr:MAG: 30S ribosomal protein S8 [Candidatus Taylorbacteria bacterium RIFCSPHIGHO2_01_FULL_44_110]OHA25451.1 MAG: 30S ribosomal protein S8 [Candidatus Taylorbacteria bacterium RIFCSPHIGHO2_02_FULL_45_28]OHA29119.1 MAG: 30S ribosomal protein S8 [Candidatus Taylorbacteria bacterium RIFCSPHIGHO2_12_FULL_45_16]OHA33341.1 MAG: 30S ribosomal protein S8 [Candidatus Taylorbacteria bacterium RIFCSPLOWO2_01_FULL_45_59]OHA38746.1 MAG: 30S ribosomal protein S8 [Candidatus Taylorbacteria bacterium RIFCSPLOW
MVTDPISNLIVRIKNASDAKKPAVTIPQSKLVENVAHALKKNGYLSSVQKNNDTREIELGIVYFDGGKPRITGIERISKTSRRVYQKSSDIRVFRSGFGNTFFSTPKGIMVDMDAKKLKVGGEVLFKIW